MSNGFGALWHSSLVSYGIHDFTGNFKERSTPQWLSISVPTDILAVFSACAVQIVVLHICFRKPSTPDIAGFFLLVAIGGAAALAIFDKKIGQLLAKAKVIAERINFQADVRARRSKKSTPVQGTADSVQSGDAVRLPKRKLQKRPGRFVLNAAQETNILERCREAIDILAGCIDRRGFVDEANRMPSMAYRDEPWYVCLCFGKNPTERYLVSGSPDLKVATTISLRREVEGIYAPGI